MHAKALLAIAALAVAGAASAQQALPAAEAGAGLSRAEVVADLNLCKRAGMGQYAVSNARASCPATKSAWSPTSACAAARNTWPKRSACRPAARRAARSRPCHASRPYERELSAIPRQAAGRRSALPTGLPFAEQARPGRCARAAAHPWVRS
ncbi:hypothetical protein PY257_14425 [Ramlibacter sp. H39-3-26]|uniref:hypothetical protein n=1 Tax=Curvibacter soli TaxID=3031331 RepID=UPI0023DA4B61|nr:hypothetical protein [Ramlibacter sp. H39-3-26]MDF1486358.1 hypothetical protein [Ramlibacter sp. H39-3-26]